MRLDDTTNYWVETAASVTANESTIDATSPLTHDTRDSRAPPGVSLNQRPAVISDSKSHVHNVYDLKNIEKTLFSNDS